MKTFELSTADFADRKTLSTLRAGDSVLLSGTVYTARDAAHKKIIQLLEAGERLPFSLQDAAIYYAGPTPETPTRPIGSFGPTTSCRMDPYTPRLLDLGLAAMIGKGPRDAAVVDAIRRNSAVYFCAMGGLGALAAKQIRSLSVIAFEELGCESVKKLEFDRFPLYVGIDPNGNTIFNK